MAQWLHDGMLRRIVARAPLLRCLVRTHRSLQPRGRTPRRTQKTINTSIEIECNTGFMPAVVWAKNQAFQAYLQRVRLDWAASNLIEPRLI